MSSPLLLKAFVNELLTAAADEIFKFFDKTIATYEEEAFCSQREIKRLRGLLLDLVSNQKSDFSQSTAYEEETVPEQQHCQQESSLSVGQSEVEPRIIKEEDQGLWVSQAEEAQVQDLKDGDVPYQPHFSACDRNEPEDTKPSLQTHSSNESEFQESEETTTAHVMLSVNSTLSSQSPVQNGSIRDSRESQRLVDCLTTADQTQTEQNQFTDLSHVNAVRFEYHCYVCGTPFPSNSSLINHALRMHSTDTGVLCAVCGKTLDPIESLPIHLNSHKGLRSCHVCGRSCNSETALTEHMSSHTGVKLYRCHVCGKECSRKGDFKIHLRIHTGEKPYCCSYCGKSFTHSGHLKKHMRTHTGERPHQCDICGKGFRQSIHLKYHRGTHV